MYWISNIDFEEVHSLTFAKRYKSTGDWLIKEPKIDQWFFNNTGLVWYYGKREYTSSYDSKSPADILSWGWKVGPCVTGHKLSGQS